MLTSDMFRPSDGRTHDFVTSKAFKGVSMARAATSALIKRGIRSSWRYTYTAVVGLPASVLPLVSGSGITTRGHSLTKCRETREAREESTYPRQCPLDHGRVTDRRTCRSAGTARLITSV